MQTESQSAQILQHLMSGKTITAIEALNLYGSFRLGARIHQLKAAGHKIASKLITTPNGKRISEYSLITEQSTKQ